MPIYLASSPPSIFYLSSLLKYIFSSTTFNIVSRYIAYLIMSGDPFENVLQSEPSHIDSWCENGSGHSQCFGLKRLGQTMPNGDHQIELTYKTDSQYSRAMEANQV